MPHDGPPHPHVHGHDHHHGHGHDHGHTHAGAGHNHVGPPPEHLHSHMHGDDAADDLRDLATAFIEGFRSADDKTSFLRLAGVPFELEDDTGAPTLKLVEVQLSNAYQVATASPAFGTPDLVYLPFHGSMVRDRTDMTFVYVSLFERRDVDLLEFLRGRTDSEAVAARV